MDIFLYFIIGGKMDVITCKTHQIVYLKWVHFIVCELCINKDDIKIKTHLKRARNMNRYLTKKRCKSPTSLCKNA